MPMDAMKLYMIPGSCSTGIHIILEELEQAFEAYIVNLTAGDQFEPQYVAINPKSTVPTGAARRGSRYRGPWPVFGPPEHGSCNIMELMDQRGSNHG
jgi:hypothetical protein